MLEGSVVNQQRSVPEKAYRPFGESRAWKNRKKKKGKRELTGRNELKKASTL